jgi:hypothetical protein
MRPVDLVLSRLEAKPSGTGWVARCPAHDDSTPSLSIAEGIDGRTLLWCFAGCALEAIADALGLTVADLFPAGHRRARRRPLRHVRRSDFSGWSAAFVNVLYCLERIGEPCQAMIVCACPYCGCPRGWLRASPEQVEFDCESGCDSENLVQSLLAELERREGVRNG